MKTEFDYVVVGAGPAGCVLANRLSASGKYSVAVIEAGPRDKNFWMTMPIGVGKLWQDPRFVWMYWTGKENALTGQKGILAARQDAGRVVVDQRHDLCARRAKAL